MRKFKSILLIIIFSFIHSAIAKTLEFIPSNQIIHLDQVIHQLSQVSTIPVIFPTKIPADPNQSHYYASLSSYAAHPDYNRYWQINIDATAECQGVKICNIGYISAIRAGKLTKKYFTLPDNQSHAKTKIKLKNNITAYYTPFHIQAGGINPTIEWQVNDILYTLSWRVTGSASQQKQTLVELLQSKNQF